MATPLHVCPILLPETGTPRASTHCLAAATAALPTLEPSAQPAPGYLPEIHSLGALDTLDAPVRQPIVNAKRPLLLATAAAGGKLLMAIGASEAVRAARTPTRADKALAGLLLGGGLTAAVYAAMQFGADVHVLASSRRAWTLKVISVSAALTLSAASAMRQILIDSDTVGLTWLPYSMATLGFALLCVSLPEFFSFSEAYRGRAVLRHRLLIERALGGAGFATGFAWASYVSAQQRVPPVVGPVILSCAATSVLLSFALFTSDARAGHAMRPSPGARGA